MVDCRQGVAHWQAGRELREEVSCFRQVPAEVKRHRQPQLVAVAELTIRVCLTRRNEGHGSVLVSSLMGYAVGLELLAAACRGGKRTREVDFVQEGCEI